MTRKFCTVIIGVLAGVGLVALPGCDWLPPGVQAAVVEHLAAGIDDEARAYVCEALHCVAFELDLNWKSSAAIPNSGTRGTAIYEPPAARPAGGG